MKYKNISPFILIFGLILTGCVNGFVNDNNANVTVANIPFENLSKQEYKIKNSDLKIYYIDNGTVPYVDILNFISTLDGYLDTSNIKYSINKYNNQLTLYYNGQYPIIFNWEKNTIYADAAYYFIAYAKSIGNSSAYSNLKSSNAFYKFGGKGFSTDIGKYYFDILYHNDKCLIPLFFANTLFCSPNYYNVFYNGEHCYGYSGEINSLDGYYDNKFNGQSVSDDMRLAAVNSLLFTFDYLYGLKEDKGYSLFKNYINKDIYSLLWSNSSSDNYLGYKQIIYGLLDELHTRIDIPSYYCDPTVCKTTSADYGEFWTNYFSRRQTQKNLRQSTLGGAIPVRYSDNIAIITFDEFLSGTTEQLFDENNHLKEDAWKYDTYYFMQYCMNDIKTHNDVEEILIDLSLNGGGAVISIFKLLGFMTDENIPYSTYDYASNSYSIYHYQVDIDGDGKYPNDAYSQYKWNLLTSLNTFSAANTTASIFDEMRLGKIFGKKSGGGMCPIMPMVLADGTAITISSNNTIRYVVNNDGNRTFYSIEHGINPDVEVEYSDFYNDSKLVEYLNNN